MMADFGYTTVPGKIKELFDKLRSTGIPSKATNQWLESLGFSSSNDRSLLAVLKQIDFCDGSGTPTEHWRQYRGGGHKAVLANAMRTGYVDLFHLYPDAWQRADSDLDSFFSTRSSAGKQVIDKTVSTFKSLTALADFSAATHNTAVDSGDEVSPATNSHPVATGKHERNVIGPSVHIDIQIHIASDATAEQIDQIFASMAKHLYKS